MVEELAKERVVETIQQEKPVVIDFWAPWCGPCRSLSPIFERLSKEFHGKIDFYKVNIDDAPEVGEKYGIRSIPCIIMFHNNKEIARSIGLLDEASLRSKLDQGLASLQ